MVLHHGADFRGELPIRQIGNITAGLDFGSFLGELAFAVSANGGFSMEEYKKR